MSKHYLCICADAEGMKRRDETLAALKQKMFPSSDALNFDLEEIEAKRMTTEKLKMSMVSIPAIAPERLVLIRQAEKMSKDCEALLEKFLREEKQAPVVFFLETASWSLKTNAHKAIAQQCTVVRVEKKEANIFDVMDRLADKVAALKVLKQVLDNEEAPEQLLGGMIWAWSNRWKERLPADKYKKGLLVLQEADHQIKRSRFPERGYALEIAVIKLSLLLKV